ncbi:hypothetical protein V3C99_008577 [Haemonchus contortus]|uniref:Uncharacterized protein n=1 Tax=Haemonchus contortus TaxID=6289 RepID=A0A7I4YL54_HAECO
MSTIIACKSKLTKAHTALEAIKSKIPQDLINPRTSELLPLVDERKLLDRRQEALKAHLSNIRAALNAVRERQQAFLAAITSSNNPVDNTIYLDYMQDSRLEDAIVTTESLIQTLQTNLEEAATRHETLGTRLPNIQQDDDARPSQDTKGRCSLRDHRAFDADPSNRFSLKETPP